MSGYGYYGGDGSGYGSSGSSRPPRNPFAQAPPPPPFYRGSSVDPSQIAYPGEGSPTIGNSSAPIFTAPAMTAADDVRRYFARVRDPAQAYRQAISSADSRDVQLSALAYVTDKQYDDQRNAVNDAQSSLAMATQRYIMDQMTKVDARDVPAIKNLQSLTRTINADTSTIQQCERNMGSHYAKTPKARRADRNRVR